MGQSFSVRGVSRLEVKQVLSATGLPNIVFRDDTPAPRSGEWPIGVSYVYQDQVSVRPIEVTLSDGNFESNIFVGSSPDDYRLGIRLAEVVASIAAAQIEPQGDAPLTIAELRKRYGDDWIDEHSRTMLRMLVAKYLDAGPNLLALGGTRRQLEVGPRFMAALLADRDSFPHRFHDRFRRLNYVDRENVQPASVFALTHPHDGREVRIATCLEGVQTLLPDRVDLVAMQDGITSALPPGGPMDPLLVPIDDLAAALGNRAVWLSEDALLVPPLSGADWRDLRDSLVTAHVEDIFAR